MSPDLVWLTIIVNVIIAVVTIANTWALAWFNKKQTESRESEAEHQSSKIAEKKINRMIIVPATLMLVVSIAGTVFSALAPATDVTTQVLRISGFIGAAVLSIVFILVGHFVSLFRSHVSVTERLIGVVGHVAENTGKQTSEL